MASLDTKSLVLDISINLSRIGRYTLEHNQLRTHQFASEVSKQLKLLSSRPYPNPLNFPIAKTTQLIDQLLTDDRQLITLSALAEDLFTYSLMLQHRSKLLA